MSVNVHISVLVPVFNHERYVARCLRSLLNQSLEEDAYEVIVVDDGSTDNSVSIVSQFGHRVKIVTRATNTGLPSALNTALTVADGEFVVRVDSDDYVNRHFLELLIEYLMRVKEADAVACDYLVVDESENVLETQNSEENPIGCGILFRRSHVLKVGGYNNEFLRAEDAEFRARFVEQYRIARLNEPLYRYRRHDTNITNNRDLLRAYLGRINAKASGRSEISS